MIGNIETIVNDVKTKINNEKEALKPIWEGLTADAFFESLSKNDEIFNNISSQLSSFSSALSEIDKLESLLSERQSLQTKCAAASTDEEKQNYESQIEAKQTDISSKEQLILKYLNEVTLYSTTLDIAGLRDLAISNGLISPGDELTADVLSSSIIQDEINSNLYSGPFKIENSDNDYLYMTDSDWDKCKYLKKEDFVCNCCGKSPKHGFDKRLIADIEKIFEENGVGEGATFKITSGYRCPTNNKNAKGSPTSRHLLGIAIDFQISNAVSYNERSAVKAQLINNRSNIYTYIQEDDWSYNMGLSIHYDLGPSIAGQYRSMK